MTTAAGLVLMHPAPAAALCLVSAPATSVRVDHPIRLGVWYREWEGGPRAYRLKVVNPRGEVIFRKAGKAPATDWKYWKVRLGRVGTFKTVYRVKNHDGEWVRAVFRTRVRR